MRLFSSVSFASFFLAVNLAKASVTLYAVENTEVDTSYDRFVYEATEFDVSAIGVNAEGATTYVDEVLPYALVEYLTSGSVPISTISSFSVPVTLQRTFVQDASGYTVQGTFSNEDGVDYHSLGCSFGSSESGTCAYREVVNSPETTFTSTSGWSGRLFAWTTIADPADSLPRETGVPDNSDATRGFGRRIQTVALAFSVLGCVWLGL
ncbi:hypothetical protein AX16_001236 [Volvariella volvacea WC 439]|nr:hypothetical protein AX16_001236 [Volvariella volvacea WC 439]